MNYIDWLHDNLTSQPLRVHDKAVSVWRTELLEARSTLLFVHGITGDHFGLVPLVEQLAGDYNCVIVELPGHGSSQPLELRDASALQQWFIDVHGAVESMMTHIDAVCAHSFGCTAVVGRQNYERLSKTILLNPVPQPSSMYAQYARLIMRFAGFWAVFYNLRVFVFLRSMTLAKVATREARRRIGFVSKYSRPSYRQIMYQAGLVDIILDKNAYTHVKDAVDLVVCGIEDTTAQQRDSLEMASVFGSSPVVFVRGGHLLPIESPGRVADLIRRVI